MMTYLVKDSRTGIYYHRRAVPAELREVVDKTAELIEERIAALVEEKKISIPRGGYLLTRGRGRVILTRVAKN